MGHAEEPLRCISSHVEARKVESQLEQTHTRSPVSIVTPVTGSTRPARPCLPATTPGERSTHKMAGDFGSSTPASVSVCSSHWRACRYARRAKRVASRTNRSSCGRSDMDGTSVLGFGACETRVHSLRLAEALSRLEQVAPTTPFEEAAHDGTTRPWQRCP